MKRAITTYLIPTHKNKDALDVIIQDFLNKHQYTKITDGDVTYYRLKFRSLFGYSSFEYHIKEGELSISVYLGSPKRCHSVDSSESSCIMHKRLLKELFSILKEFCTDSDRSTWETLKDQLNSISYLRTGTIYRLYEKFSILYIFITMILLCCLILVPFIMPIFAVAMIGIACLGLHTKRQLSAKVTIMLGLIYLFLDFLTIYHILFQ